MNKLSFTLLSFAITALIIVMIMLPIYQACGDKYPAYLPNIACIIIALTFTRFLFLLDYHWFGSYNRIKTILAFLVIPIGLFIVDAHYEFQRFVDEEGYEAMLISDDDLAVAKYAKNQFVFFWSWAMICCAAIPIKMIRSIWRDYKSRIK